MATAIIALGINTSAQNCEIIRAGLLAVKKEYFECSEALGYTKMQTLLYFVLPISFRLAFKSLVNPVVEKAMHSLSLEDKITYLECGSQQVQEYLERIDFEARKLAYQYLKLMLTL